MADMEVTSGYGASKNVESSCSGDGPYREILTEEANGSSSDLFVLLHGSIWP